MPKSKRFKRAMICLSIVIIFLIIISMPIFAIDSIIIIGAKSLTEENVLASTGLDDNPNFFFFSSKKAKNELKNNPYIEDVSVKKIFPSSVSVQVHERDVVAYVEDKGNFIYIDRDGRVLDVSKNFTKRLPVIVGLDYNYYTVGEVLDIDNNSSFKAVVTLSNLFTAYDLETEIIRVDIGDENDIHLFIYNVDVTLGSVRDANEKIKTLKGILEAYPELKTERGYLNLDEPYTGYAASFRFMT